MTEDHSARSQGADHATDNASTSKENGDRAGVYDIKLHTSPVSPIANRPTRLLLVVTKLAAHDPIREFDLVHDRLMHLTVVSEDLAFFDHVHPELGNGVFRLAYRFPEAGPYTLWGQFLRAGLVVTAAFVLDVVRREQSHGLTPHEERVRHHDHA